MSTYFWLSLTQDIKRIHGRKKIGKSDYTQQVENKAKEKENKEFRVVAENFL